MNIWTFYFQIVHNRGHEVFNDEWTFGLHEPYELQEKKRLKRLSALCRSCYNVEVCCVWEALVAG